jgi:hypothetical protein
MTARMSSTWLTGHLSSGWYRLNNTWYSVYVYFISQVIGWASNSRRCQNYQPSMRTVRVVRAQRRIRSRSKMWDYLTEYSNIHMHISLASIAEATHGHLHIICDGPEPSAFASATSTFACCYCDPSRTCSNSIELEVVPNSSVL